MSKKFGKDREVSLGYAKIPLYYTGIKHPHRKYTEFVIMDQIGKSYSACWRNAATSKTGIEILIPSIKGGFVFKGKEYLFKNCNKVW